MKENAAKAFVRGSAVSFLWKVFPFSFIIWNHGASYISMVFLYCVV